MGETENLSYSWFWEFWTCPWLPKPILLIFGDAKRVRFRTPRDLATRIWEDGPPRDAVPSPTRQATFSEKTLFSLFLLEMAHTFSKSAEGWICWHLLANGWSSLLIWKLNGTTDGHRYYFLLRKCSLENIRISVICWTLAPLFYGVVRQQIRNNAKPFPKLTFAIGKGLPTKSLVSKTFFFSPKSALKSHAAITKFCNKKYNKKVLNIIFVLFFCSYI